MTKREEYEMKTEQLLEPILKELQFELVSVTATIIRQFSNIAG